MLVNPISKKTINLILNAKYNKITFDKEKSIVVLKYKPSMLKKDMISQTLQFYELKNYCLNYANKQNFKNKLNNNTVDFIEWFKMFQNVLNQMQRETQKIVS